MIIFKTFFVILLRILFKTVLNCAPGLEYTTLCSIAFPHFGVSRGFGGLRLREVAVDRLGQGHAAVLLELLAQGLKTLGEGGTI